MKPRLEAPVLVFRRGFPERLEIDVDAFDAVPLATMPLRELVVCGVRAEHVDALVARPAIAGVNTFGLRHATLEGPPLRELGNAPLVRAAETFALHRGRFNTPISLGAWELPAMHTLHIDDANLRDVRALNDAAWLPRVRTLRLRNTQLDYSRWLSTRGWTQLVELRIENTMWDPDLARIVRSPVGQQLERLELVLGHGDVSTRNALTSAKTLPRLQQLVVRTTELDFELEGLRERWGAKLTFV
ncbi:MAG: hypothetical protein QM831_31665 [Kofleriaceae bacterium]